MEIKKVLTPAVIERTNQTYPEYKDILCLTSHFDTMQISFDTYKIHNVKHLFSVSEKEAKKRHNISIELTYDEAVILKNKLQEFIDAYDEYAKYNFMVGEHESLLSEDDSIDVDLVPDLPLFTSVKDVDLGDKKPIEPSEKDLELLAYTVSECDRLGIGYEYKNPEIKAKVEKMIELAKDN